jgi:hypothetical protein
VAWLSDARGGRFNPLQTARKLFYRADLLGNGHNRLVYVDDNCVGRCDEYSTTIWIFKPGTEAKLKEYHWPDANGQINTWNLFDPDVIESRIGFNLRPRTIPALAPNGEDPMYPEIYGRFLDRHLRRFVSIQEWYKNVDGEDVRNNPAKFIETLKRYIDTVGGSGPFIQQIWKYHGQVFFTARSWPSSVLVYRYIGKNAIEEVCLLGPSSS